MGWPRAPPAPRWRRGLRALCWWLLSLARTSLSGLLVLWRLAWYLLICYKICWDIIFEYMQELGAAVLLSLESGGEASEEAGGSPPVADLEQAGPGELQRLRDTSATVLKRLEALEADISFFSTELGAEKLLWSSRFLELLREQQALAARVSGAGDAAAPAPRQPGRGPPRPLPQPRERQRADDERPELRSDADGPGASDGGDPAAAGPVQA